MLHSIEEVKQMIGQGKRLCLAGSERCLAELPAGTWIGGTIPYFMGPDGGVCTEHLIFVNEVPDCASKVYIREYTAEGLTAICTEAPMNGYSFIVVPAGSAAHAAYAENAPSYEDMFIKPVVGWITGVNVSELGKTSPRVFNGETGKSSTESAVVMHVELPSDKVADVNITNVFQPGPGDAITFPAGGFEVKDCLVNDQKMNFVEYINSVKPDSHVPLTADYAGSIVNVSIQSLDQANGTVRFYAPVFPHVTYKFAGSVSDYVAAFDSITNSENGQADFSCNCILNYLYANLEGKRTGTITGPITFGEIAHQLLNQTMVQLRIRDLN